MINMGLNTYSTIGAFDTSLGNSYIIMSDKSRSRFLPIILRDYQREALYKFGSTESERNLGVYTSILDLWEGIGLKLSGMTMTECVQDDGKDGVNVDMVLTQSGEDGLHILHVPFILGDAAVLSMLFNTPIMIGKDISQNVTISLKARGLSDEALLEGIISEIENCEKTISSIDLNKDFKDAVFPDQDADPDVDQDADPDIDPDTV